MPNLPPQLSWEEFRAGFDWRQGAHLTVVAPNGWGKTVLIRELLRPSSRPAPWTVFVSTKRRDPEIDRLTRMGFQTQRRFQVTDADIMPQVVLAPRVSGFASIDKQRDIFREALDSIFRMGGWTIVLDELRYLTEFLGLRREVEVMLQQGRSHGLTVVSGAQRPRHVPLLAFDQPRHLFFGRDNDQTNVKRLAEIGGGIDARAVQATIGLLELHEMLYVDTEPPGRMCRTRVET